jgi:hypothetical protein
MSRQKAILSSLATPAFLLLVATGLELWFSIQVSRLAGGLPAAQVCSASGLSRAIRYGCESRNVAIIAMYAGGVLALLSVSAFLALAFVTGWVRKHPVRFAPACRLGYRISVCSACVTWVLCFGILVPFFWLLLIKGFSGSSWDGLNTATTAACLVIVITGVIRLLRADPKYPGASIQVWGKIADPTSQTELFQVLERVSNSAGCPIPPNVVLGLDPRILCTRRSVSLDDSSLEGGTLFLSLPLFRLLTEAETTSLIAIEMASSKIASPDFEAWLLSADRKWKRIRRQMKEGPLKIRVHVFALLWHWLDEWSDWRTSLTHFAVRHAAVAAGRENTASSIAKAQIYPPQWDLFLDEVQAGLRSGKLSNDVNRLSAPSNPMNLSLQFAERMDAMSEQLARPMFSEDKRELTEEQAALVTWIRALHADPMEIGRRLVQPSADRAIRWFSGVESVEAELSLAQIRKIFFVREDRAASDT